MRHNFSPAMPAGESAGSMYFFREWRKHRGLKQEDLADQVGLTASSISQLEHGKQGFTDSTLAALANALGCRPGDLLLWGPGEVEASTGPIRGADNIRKVLERIEGLKAADVTALLAVIDGFQRANAGQPEQFRPGGRSEPATHRHESAPSR